jgi:peptide/nickel transport system substrate-binding protein
MLAIALVTTVMPQGATAATVKQGGSLVFGAEQEPGCADFFSTCVGTAWGRLLFAAQLMPRAFDFDGDNYQPGAVLASMPELEVLCKVCTAKVQKVTYKLNPKAVWSDGKPITSEDFQYTWQEVMTGKLISSKAGYSSIKSVDTPDPQTAVVTFSTPYAPWRDLFGGSSGILPKHILLGKDRNSAMKSGFKWSGGPWLLDHWTKGQEFKMVPNKKFWGQVPHLDSVTFKFTIDTGAQMAAYKSGQVSMVYPQAQVELSQLRGLPNNLAVRQAMAYALDRQAIVTALFGNVQPGIKAGQAWMADGNSEWGGKTMTPFAKYTKDLKKVDELMTGAGYAKDSKGYWAKDGARVSMNIKTTAGNKRRELTEQLVQGYFKAAGFEIYINNETVSDLLGATSRNGNFDMILAAAIPASNDPGQCSSMCSSNIGTTNTGRIKDSQLDTTWLAVDKELNFVLRKQLVKTGQDRIADVLPGLPLDNFPDIIVWNKSLIGGPVKHNAAFGPWVNMNEWYRK